MVKFCRTDFGQTPVCVPVQNPSDGTGGPPFDSSVGRAEDCRLITAVILRSLVQLRLEGRVFPLYLFSVGRIIKAMVFRHVGFIASSSGTGKSPSTSGGAGPGRPLCPN